MARKLRVEFSGACYHVINGGPFRRGIFGTEGRANSFEKALFEACEKYGWRLHANVVMSNHYRLALETPESNLSLGMKWLQGTWAIRSNHYHGLNGRPFQGRYKALLVEPGHEWEIKLVEEAVRLGINLEKLPARKSAPDRVRLAATLRASCSVSNGWLADRLAMDKPPTVSQYVRRFLLERNSADEANCQKSTPAPFCLSSSGLLFNMNLPTESMAT